MGTTDNNSERYNRLTVECPVVRDEAVEAAAAMLFNHDPQDYVSQCWSTHAMRSTQELQAVPEFIGED